MSWFIRCGDRERRTGRRASDAPSFTACSESTSAAGSGASSASRWVMLAAAVLATFGFAVPGSAHAQSLPGSSNAAELGEIPSFSSAWIGVTSPDASAGNNLLSGVATVSSGDVWAVGSAEDVNGNAQPLREHWNGAAWTIVAGPNNFDVLNGVAAASTNAVWAVGQGLDGAAIERWNGLVWRKAKNPVAGPGTTLNGVAAASPGDVWAVGEATATGTAQTFIEHLTGHHWTVVPSPDAGDRNNLLIAVAAVSATDVWAAGDFQNDQNVFQTLIEHWDGMAWSIVPSPSGPGVQAGLLSVAALSRTNVWAAGDSGSATLIEHWDGSDWTVVPSPTPPGTLFNPVFGVAPVSARSIWAVGQTQNGTTGSPTTLIEHWNGRSWSLVPSPSPGSQATLTAAAADRTSGQAWAVGNSTDPGTGAQRTLTEFNP
jgi:hypothetical protein